MPRKKNMEDPLENSLDLDKELAQQPEIESKKPDTVEVPATVMKDLLDRLDRLENKTQAPETQGVQMEAFVNALKEIVSTSKEKSDSDKFFGEEKYTRVEDIDPEDFEEDGKTFFAPCVFFVISDDKKMGLPVKTPFGTVIAFQYQSTIRKANGKEHTIINTCTYTSYSKKEIAWLKNHSDFGVRFFSDIKSALLNDDLQVSLLVSRYMSQLEPENQMDIMRKAKENGIPVSTDPQNMRIQLAQKYATEQVAEEKKLRKRMTAEAVKEAVFEEK